MITNNKKINKYKNNFEYGLRFLPLETEFDFFILLNLKSIILRLI